MIYTTYFDNVKNLDKNIIPIAICGKCPDDWKGLKFPKLAPKKKFWEVWEKQKITTIILNIITKRYYQNLKIPLKQ